MGNSYAVRLPKFILKELNLRENDRVEIHSVSNEIVIRPSNRRYTSLDEIFEGYTGDYNCTEVGTCLPFGLEVY